MLCDTCLVWCPKTFPVQRSNLLSQKHQPQMDQLPTSPAVHPLLQHFAVLKPARQLRGCTASQQLGEEHFQRFLFLFLFPYDHVFHPSSSSPRYRPAMAHKMPEAAVLCCKNRCFFNCPSHRHNWCNEETHKIGCSTRVKGGSFPQLLREEKKSPSPSLRM